MLRWLPACDIERTRGSGSLLCTPGGLEIVKNYLTEGGEMADSIMENLREPTGSITYNIQNRSSASRNLTVARICFITRTGCRCIHHVALPAVIGKIRTSIPKYSAGYAARLGRVDAREGGCTREAID